MDKFLRSRVSSFDSIWTGDSPKLKPHPNNSPLMSQGIGLISLAMSLFVLSACVHSLSLYSMDGEKLSGRWRFSRENNGVVEVTGSNGEVLNGKFATVERATFVESYQKTFGTGSIRVDGPDLSSYGNSLAAIFGSSAALTDSAHGETFNPDSDKGDIGVNGPLFYWIASLRGDRKATMECFFIGSSYTGGGFGRCKSHTGKEYSLEF